MHRILLCAFMLCWCLALSCTTRGDDQPRLAITYQPHPAWELYYTHDSILRFRKKAAEALIDLSVVSLGSGGAYPDFKTFYTQFSQVSMPSSADKAQDILLDGAPGKLIQFSGWRPDTGQPTAGMRWLVERGGKAYSFVFLDAGPSIEENRSQAKALIASIRFDK